MKSEVKLERGNTRDSMKGGRRDMTQYLVTGATGQIGNTIVRMLLDNQKKVRVLVNPEEDTTPLAGLPVEVSYGDILVKDSMKEFFDLEDPRDAILIHAQERNVITDKTDLMVRRVNVHGTMNITDTCVKKKIGKLIYIGSARAIPLNESRSRKYSTSTATVWLVTMLSLRQKRHSIFLIRFLLTA